MDGIFLVSFLLLVTFIVAAAFYFVKVHTLKFIAVALAAFVSSAVYFSFDNYKGWPTHNKYPTGWVVGIEIREPNQEMKDEGEIFIWLYPKTIKRSLFGYAPIAPTPRGYRLPFNNETSKQMSDAKQKMKQGYQVLIEGDDEGGEDGAGEKESNNSKKKVSEMLKITKLPH